MAEIEMTFNSYSWLSGLPGTMFVKLAAYYFSKNHSRLDWVFEGIPKESLTILLV